MGKKSLRGKCLLKNIFLLVDFWASLVAQRVKRLPAMWETWVQSLGGEDPLEKEMANHSSILAWKIPWTEKPGRLQTMGSQRVRHDWVTSLSFTLVDFYLVYRKVGLYFTKKSDVMSLYHCVIALIMHSSGLLTRVITF